MPADDIAVIGAVNMRERVRTLKSGATRSKVTLEIQGDSIGLNLDPRSYGKPVAEAMAELFRERIRSITATASAATIAYRARAKKALADGASWAQKRYAGGRTGQKDPGQSDRLFNDSGRFADSFVVGARPGEQGFTINVASNRLNPNTFSGGIGALERMYQRLVQLVPELADPKKLLDSIPIRKAIDQSIRDNVIKGDEKTWAAKRQLLQARIQVAKALLSLVA